ncbi:hypothetical protein P872_24820 [Rhodonellum psychrophilum GCM71 = DSM 17998]|uniref:Uncharacterized protein n=2 Tax=Rhodonellum TaxID=336827 RepID=U5C3K7_9BACT|nr:hypothetical protein P872_24820 [Rhodonellum psychrophilum GCM71 = DSM 17998]SDY87371.1 hypothetical protein SAMN05444412_103223 [Rhodonellum ikkaensis]
MYVHDSKKQTSLNLKGVLGFQMGLKLQENQTIWRTGLITDIVKSKSAPIN